MHYLDRYEIALRAEGENTDTALIILRRLERDGLPIPFTKDDILTAMSELRDRMAPNSVRRYVSVLKSFSRWYAEEYDAAEVFADQPDVLAVVRVVGDDRFDQSIVSWVEPVCGRVEIERHHVGSSLGDGLLSRFGVVAGARCELEDDGGGGDSGD